MEKQTGKTKDVGFQFGIRKTFAFPAEKAWDFLFSKEGLEIWLGKLENEFDLMNEYKTKNGTTGFVRVFKPNSHIRLDWKKENWENSSRLQIRVIENGDKTTISFHQEKLHDATQRAEMEEYWHKVMVKLTDYFDNTKL